MAYVCGEHIFNGYFAHFLSARNEISPRWGTDQSKLIPQISLTLVLESRDTTQRHASVLHRYAFVMFCSIGQGPAYSGPPILRSFIYRSNALAEEGSRLVDDVCECMHDV